MTTEHTKASSDNPQHTPKHENPAPQEVNEQAFLPTTHSNGKVDIRALTPRNIMQLQRIIGNQSVQRLLAKRSPRIESAVEPSSLVQRVDDPVLTSVQHKE